VLFTGVDRAVFGASFADRLRRAGLPVPLSSTHRFLHGLETVGPLSKHELYWLGRISLVSRHQDLALYDRVFAAVFDVTLEEMKNPQSRRAVPAPPPRSDDVLASVRIPQVDESSTGGGLPWVTLPSASVDDDTDDDTHTVLPERLPASLAAEVDTPFDLLDPDQLHQVEAVLTRALHEWPVRSSRRRQAWPSGSRVELRATLRAAQRTGGEAFVVHRTRQRTRARKVVVLVDVSGSMQTFVRPYLHLTRALVMAGRAEVFAFATDLTRITASLRLRSPAEAIDRASAEVGDRFGGTRLATNIRQLLNHRRWGTLVRGAIVVIASDGWDTDPPAELDRQMLRLARRAHRVVWLNPRSAAPDYEPLVGSMSAALPHCSLLLSGHSLGAMAEVIDAICDDRDSTRRSRIRLPA
jgi:uncharacterized protein with von Willebrand factor type A (vWA) domain